MSQFEVILSHVPPLLLVVFRLGGLMVFAPVFGSAAIPGRVKVFLSLVIGLAIYPLLSREVFAAHPLHLDLWSLAPLMATELLIGLIVGYVAALPMIAVQTGGLIMGQQMGLGFASFYNPGLDDEADVVGQILFYLALAGFLLVGGHEALVLAILHTFEHVPLGQFVVDGSLIALITGLLLAAFELALRVAAPVLAVVFLQSVALGFITKTVPQLNILSLGFPMRILVGVTVVMLGLTVINEVLMEAIDVTLTALFEWIES
ncbi:MAG: flagellar biosynthetic protein FliR [Phycisphaerales bacterium]|nr:flagellar biosynthetic protein FliR [Phycisphaerae bacterium]NNF44154.1 flagellar biosynthetic protein FliR [Phycisphaerales bacterium]NNM24468.1 flagellar biosynthetic protein FliR [Phycisphaerales bacterium]